MKTTYKPYNLVRLDNANIDFVLRKTVLNAYLVFYTSIRSVLPVSVVALSKAYVYGRSPAEIVGSITTGPWKFVCCECHMLSRRGLCDGLIARPEESYRLWRVVLCDQETSKTRRLKPATGQPQ
jgi:hypothetical protein